MDRQSGPWVYVIGSEPANPVKIGTTTNDPHARLSQIRTGSPFVLRILLLFQGGRPLEIALHRKFAEYRLAGEWFDLSGLGDLTEVITAAVEEVKAGLPVQRVSAAKTKPKANALAVSEPTSDLAEQIGMEVESMDVQRAYWARRRVKVSY